MHDCPERAASHRKFRWLPQAFIGFGLLALLSVPTVAQGPDFARWQQADAATQRATLLLARQAFDAYALRRETIEPPRTLPACLRTRSGVFVSTMRANGSPRCCMGTLYPTQPNVAEEIIANAGAAAGRDHRFAPIQPSELGRLRLIVSIVSPPHPIAAHEAGNLDPTRDGLVVQFGERSGVILSGETDDAQRMIAWGRIRAGAKPTDAVQFFRIQSVRMIEPSPEKTP